jgi:hypothetical protein
MAGLIETLVNTRMATQAIATFVKQPASLPVLFEIAENDIITYCHHNNIAYGHITNGHSTRGSQAMNACTRCDITIRCKLLRLLCYPLIIHHTNGAV